MYIATQTRSDLAVVSVMLDYYLHKLKMCHITAVKRAWRYPSRTEDMRKMLKTGNNDQAISFRMLVREVCLKKEENAALKYWINMLLQWYPQQRAFKILWASARPKIIMLHWLKKAKLFIAQEFALGTWLGSKLVVHISIRCSWCWVVKSWDEKAFLQAKIHWH